MIRGLIRPAAADDVPRSLAHIEFQMRTAGLIVAGTSGTDAPLFPGSLEKWTEYVRIRTETISCSECATRLAHIAATPEAVGTGTISFRTARNEVFHGGPVPPGLDISALLDAITANNRDIHQIADHHPELVAPPFFYLASSKPYILNDYDGASAKYWPAEGSAIDIRDEQVLAKLASIRPRAAVRQFESFASDIERDLRGFAENRDVRVFVDDATDGVALVAQWSRRTSEGPEPRIDRFHLAPHGERIWWTEGNASAYRNLLKSVSNWDLLKARLAADLEETQNAQSELNSSLFEHRFVELPHLEQFVRTSADLPNGSGSPTFSAFCASIAESAYRFNGGTRLVTFTGEAGAGKTHSLLRFARTSLGDASDGREDQGNPIVLFISSSGRAANTLDTLIESRVAETRLIDKTGVLALCRAGLLVLVIDGFDELLGFRTYDEPLKAIQPILDELRGHGTIVLSARSSYAETRISNQVAVQAAQNWPPRIDSAEILPLTEAQVISALSAVGQYEVFRESEPRLRRLISTPFFCASFASWAALNEPTEFIEFVLDSYLRREQKKLQGPEGEPLLGRSVLAATLGEVAEIAARSGSSEVSESDLQLAAEGANGAELSMPAKRRLTTLCAVSAEWSEDENSFSFAHTVVYEYFLAKQLSGKSTKQIVEFCTTVAVSPLTARLFKEQVAIAPLTSVLSGLKTTVASLQGSIDDHIEARTSLGSIWSETALQASSANVVTLAGAICGGQIHAPSGASYVLEDCSVDLLVMDPGSKVEVRRCSIRHIDARGITPGTLVVDSLTIVDELMTATAFLTSDAAIRKELGLSTESNDGFSDAFGFFSRKLEASHYSSIVIDSATRLPAEDDRRSAWALTFGREAWHEFLKKSESDGRAHSTHMNTSGSPKERVWFTGV
ncbi:NACHT domain-containing NTPase [Cellulomonas sp. PhB150]|uniref:NACHT domain-containing protein n=1 Tax=Cellulomonas sp. PhB150 TaxID=2485188 RepID=UPI000FB14AB5|nr:hypothetical protein [Cellulomonas sp. PhB150]ROS30651.1 hypothetical protein EDF34_0290 [Cellulomonas sp. PhB150]